MFKGTDGSITFNVQEMRPFLCLNWVESHSNPLSPGLASWVGPGLLWARPLLYWPGGPEKLLTPLQSCRRWEGGLLPPPGQAHTSFVTFLKVQLGVLSSQDCSQPPHSEPSHLKDSDPGTYGTILSYNKTCGYSLYKESIPELKHARLGGSHLVKGGRLLLLELLLHAFLLICPQ